MIVYFLEVSGSLDHCTSISEYPANIYLFKFNNKNIGKRCEICSELTIKTPKDVVLVFLLLTLNIFYTCFLVFPLLTLNK